MQGTIKKQKLGFHWMRIGFAENRFANLIRITGLLAIIIFAVWTFRVLPKTDWRILSFVVIYLVAVLLYMNLGVWLHEQLHCLSFRFSTPKKSTEIVFSRHNPLFLTGYYRVKGAISYQTTRRALLAPIALPIGLIIIGWVGSLFLPGWWLPVLLSLASAGLIDMTHDIYMASQISKIGEKGRYWDHGQGLDVVWKEADL